MDVVCKILQLLIKTKNKDVGTAVTHLTQVCMN